MVCSPGLRPLSHHLLRVCSPSGKEPAFPAALGMPPKETIMKSKKLHRRRFLKQASAGAAALSAAAALPAASLAGGAPSALALRGGKPVRTERFPSWPVIGQNDRAAWQKVLEEGTWCRLNGQYANLFEKVYAE